MNKQTRIARMIVLGGLVALMPLAASALKMKDFIGVYMFTGGPFTNATVMLNRYNIATKHARTPDAHPLAGQWKWKAGKKNIKFLWPYCFMEVHVVDLANPDVLTGTYTKASLPSFFCTLTRTNLTLIDPVVNWTRPRSVYGMALSSEIKTLPLPDLRIIIYSRIGTNATLQLPDHRFRPFGTFYHVLSAGYDFADAYVISNGFVPPPTLTEPMPVDGSNVWAYDWQTNKFKFFDRSTTNNPNVF